jgi:dTDP-4-dehydrorhamnose reductase
MSTFHATAVFSEVLFRILKVEEGPLTVRQDFTISPADARDIAKQLLKAARAAEKTEA